MPNKLLAAAAASMFMFLFGSSAIAGIVTTSFGVSITITASCSIGSAASLNFGGVAGTATAPSPISTAFNVTCTLGTPYDVTFTGANDTDKQMAGPSGAFIKYAISIDSLGLSKLGKTLGVPAGTGSSGINGIGTGIAIPTTVYAAINTTSWTNIASRSGTYSDTVTVTVNF